MGKQERFALKRKGFFLSIILFVFIVICIFLAGFDYRQAIHRWTDDSPYGALQIALVVISFVLIILSFLIFTMCSTNKGLIFFVYIYIITK